MLFSVILLGRGFGLLFWIVNAVGCYCHGLLLMWVVIDVLMGCSGLLLWLILSLLPQKRVDGDGIGKEGSEGDHGRGKIDANKFRDLLQVVIIHHHRTLRVGHFESKFASIRQ